ncbi:MULTISPECIES: rubrerythrin-like domain-containing protein [Natrialba]|uniref:Rubrerythrin-like domain-containing protein n=1 Tax=Natrialba swarupiae TaxID=2448032 RepID=A0A5D5AHP5_9EURY|nr:MULTISPECIES: rubrerythrin-like domain-containing protein [Natrialba]MCW8172434.1 rubrerythrin-like domain-containing protein [Natrialba swarupiae]MWV39853.1 rubrerythrin-like domain-containing protein [Natrialba sp. INN-245]TYT60453.1 rubrerythrin-like domain-containing protein [Natrialba swarupiae]
MKDVQLDPGEESTYECFDCGTVVIALAPEACPNCGADMRNRRTPIE